jgi:tyrosine-protein kinase Etk/Wzc
MKQADTAIPSGKENADEDINIFDFLIVLAKHRKKLIFLPISVAVIAAASSFLLPDVYQASTKLMPPQQSQSSGAALLSQLGGVAGLAAGAGGLKNPNDLYIAMLKSRTVGNRIVERFDLKKRYDTESLEKARTKLFANTTVAAGKDGLITLDFEDKDQKLVAKLANAYIEELFRLTKVLAVTEAGQRRVFYEQQFEQAKNNLAKAEASLRGAIDTRGVVSVDVESRAVLETVARLRAQISAKEIQIDAMRPFVTASHPDFQRFSQELNSLQAELSRLQNGREQEKKPDGGSVADTQGGLQNVQLLRDMKYYQTLYEILAKQYEVARLDEAKDPAVLQVLDPAVEPERKFKPKRALIVLIATLLAAVMAVVWAFASELRRKTSNSAIYAAKLSELRSHLRSK